MGRRNIYLPDDLDAQVRAAGLNVSQVCQDALRKAVLTDTQVQALADQVLARHQPRDQLDLPPIAQPIDPVEQMIGCAGPRHVGPIKRLGQYSKQCQACGQAV
jgi:Post-segregation antitoxin CcdA